ncbi:hypothetical protein RM697_01295 [Ichthyenterobacterium sp. W332]|uniref:Uncharacterized protein n=1 Tax=Microcosmobacter mediterraneus TaxID=3075607 RepID=A0ABU2YH84_9FLAO|nr:hypothetical protein [Ichthyenterobacterium sp. W332]MDT0557261.1 hypothetical protein [Ichthyenterobacterium sp. W332]
MKKLVLLFTGLLMGLTTVTAAETSSATQGTDLDNTRYRYTQPILFVERGVEFLIFPDGSFDFNTDFNTTSQTTSVYYRRNRRGSVNSTFGAPGRGYYDYSRPRGVLVTHDRSGRVRRVGNVFINYDRHSRVKRVGSVYMRYRHGLLKQVGGLHIQYNRRGDMIGTNGFVNFSNQGNGIFGIDGSLNDFNNNWNDDDLGQDWDDDFYYYRRNGETKKMKKQKRSKR